MAAGKKRDKEVTRCINRLARNDVDWSTIDKEGRAVHQQFFEAVKREDTKKVRKFIRRLKQAQSAMHKDLCCKLSKNVQIEDCGLCIPVLRKSIDIPCYLPGNVKTTPLLYASHRGNFEIIEQLLDAGADVNQKTYFGDPALLTVLREFRKDVARLFIEKGVDVNAKCEHAAGNNVFAGNTVLMCVIESNVIAEDKFELIKLLTQAKGYDKNLKNNKGKTAMEIAKDKKNRATSQEVRDFYQAVLDLTNR